MRVHHLNCGTLRPLGGRLVDGEPGLFRRSEMVCHCLLLETDTGLALVDTGLGTPTVSRPHDWLGAPFVRLVNPDTGIAETAVQQITRLGFDPSDVRHIVMTHLDVDHAGGLVDFPDATVHVHAEELRTARHPQSSQERFRYRAAHFVHGPRWSSYSALGEPWWGFDAVRSLDGLPPTILLIPLAGHTRGHVGVAVHTGNGWLLHAGDAYFHPGEIDPDRPHCPAGTALFEAMVQTEKRSRIHNQKRLRELVRDHKDQVRVFSAHSGAEFHQAVGEEPGGADQDEASRR